MRIAASRLTQSTIAAGALLLAMTTAIPATGDVNLTLTMRTVAIDGNGVMFAVTNSATRMQTGTVAAKILTSRGEVSAMAPFTVSAGQTATIKMVLPDPVLGVLPLGVVVDDGVPF